MKTTREVHDGPAAGNGITAVLEQDVVKRTVIKRGLRPLVRYGLLAVPEMGA